MRTRGGPLAATVVIAGMLAPQAGAQGVVNAEVTTPADVARVIKPQFSPYAGRSFPTRPLFGDTRLHPSVSVDAGTLNRHLNPRPVEQERCQPDCQKVHHRLAKQLPRPSEATGVRAQSHA